MQAQTRLESPDVAMTITADSEHKTIALEHYETAPILLKGVKRGRGSE